MRLPCWRERLRAAALDDSPVTCQYPKSVEAIRKKEYPLLQGRFLPLFSEILVSKED